MVCIFHLLHPSCSPSILIIDSHSLHINPETIILAGTNEVFCTQNVSTAATRRGDSIDIHERVSSTIITATYCDVLPGNASNNLLILDFMLGLLDISSGGIYNCLLQS
jgi:hypothetical protein